MGEGGEQRLDRRFVKQGRALAFFAHVRLFLKRRVAPALAEADLPGDSGDLLRVACEITREIRPQRL